MKYPDQVGQIQNKIAELLNVQASVYPYVNMGQADPRIPHPELVHDMEWTYGKFIVQYDPQDGVVSHTMPNGWTCDGIQAGLQVLAGDSPFAPVVRKTWLAELNQIDLSDLNLKRDNAPKCSKNDYSSGLDWAPTGMPAGGAGGSGSTFKTSAASHTAKPTKSSSGHLSGPAPSCQSSTDCTDYCGSEGPGCGNGQCICDPEASMIPTTSIRPVSKTKTPSSVSKTKTPSSITPGPSSGPSGSAQQGDPLCVNSANPDVSGVSCVCSTKSFGQEIVTSFALPYTAGTKTVSYQCNEITEYPSTDYTSTITPAPYTPPIVHDYTSKDANQNLVVFTAASVEYGAMDVGSSAMQFAETYGIGKPTRTITHVPTPTAACSYWNWVLGDTFVIYNIQDWKGQDEELAKDGVANPGSDDLSDLFDTLKSKIEAHNCGAITNWKTDNDVPQFGPAVKFSLGTSQATCVDHAIQDAGGPPEGCASEGTQLWDISNSVADTLADHYS
ncbi:uncharacterized protein PFLUO_LOCUS7132 [Penicillium psychrofluorescens]|uniref:uncharacterized protein n=1 Tax=Penicillium psychrofluorescens TaxID=3158075 RepID=UPI003CCCF8BB